MVYVKVGCPVCQTGVLGIRRCSDGRSLVVMCDECEAIWESPKDLGTGAVLEAEPPAFWIEQLGVAIAGDAAGWASEAEVATNGWSSFVQGVQQDA
jgi:hypothetical protein